ncbi:MAG TPA: hypothetical protein VFE23_07515 [Usitatibacter sp.]|jgi:hypothetical protein|nr:hypothetical protein [Usitatibacter sp.]
MQFGHRAGDGTAAAPPNTRLAALGFRPAFLDWGTMAIHRARFGDGRLAPYHALEGLPDALIELRAPSGRVALLKPSVVIGYERGGYFYTRRSAAHACEQWVL